MLRQESRARVDPAMVGRGSRHSPRMPSASPLLMGEAFSRKDHAWVGGEQS